MQMPLSAVVSPWVFHGPRFLNSKYLESARPIVPQANNAQPSAGLLVSWMDEHAVGASRDLENSAGVRHHLPGLGLDLPRHPHRRPRDAAVPNGRLPLHRGGGGALRMDAPSRDASSHAPSMAWRYH